MIIVQLNGGMGNQMFQYATARAIAIRSNGTLKLDTNFFKTVVVDTPREYELHKLSVLEEFATDDEIARIKGYKPSFSKKVLDRLFPRNSKKHVVEYNMNFRPELLNMGGDLYLEGFWQTEKYFLDVRNQIQQEFSVKKLPSTENAKLLQIIANCTNPVSIHVRRGDYITNKQANSFHGVCSPEYYNNSIKLMKDRLENPTFFIFSDEPDWAKANLNTGTETHVSYNLQHQQDEDLRLMYSCKHHIIANSSFSWWGAWLSPNPNKIVCAPEQWFVNKDANASNIVPTSWLRING